MGMKVKKVKASLTRHCLCGGWLTHWEKYGGGRAGMCAVTACPHKAVDGGLVQKDLGEDGARYVIPLCAHHAALQAELSISAYTRFVAADLKQTCEQRPPLFVRTGLGRAKLI